MERLRNEFFPELEEARLGDGIWSLRNAVAIELIGWRVEEIEPGGHNFIGANILKHDPLPCGTSSRCYRAIASINSRPRRWHHGKTPGRGFFHSSLAASTSPLNFSRYF